MKGTAPRGATNSPMRAPRRALAASPKDRAENLMIVDLLRNDLGRLALIGSVVGAAICFAVETYPTLHTMVSTVTAQLRPATRAEAIVRALFPCGSVTGAPKIRAMEIIRELEASPRGVYCGAIGYFAPDGSAKFNVAIRTLTIEGGQGELGIGGAWCRIPAHESEYAECLLKARYFDSVRAADRTDRDAALRERLHPSRPSSRSHAALFSDVLGLPFDRDAALRALRRRRRALRAKHCACA